MKLEKRTGNVFYSPTLEDMPLAYDSEANDESWMDEFNAMAAPDWEADILEEFNSVLDEEETPTAGWFTDKDGRNARVTHRQESAFIDADTPCEPVQAWLNSSKDECVILLEDETSILCAVRELWQNGTRTYLLIGIMERVWALCHAHKAAVRNLGFSPRLNERGEWEIVYQPTEVAA